METRAFAYLKKVDTLGFADLISMDFNRETELIYPFKRHSHKMVKHTQTISRRIVNGLRLPKFHYHGFTKQALLLIYPSNRK